MENIFNLLMYLSWGYFIILAICIVIYKVLDSDSIISQEFNFDTIFNFKSFLAMVYLIWYYIEYIP